jgi:hypothetical protein
VGAPKGTPTEVIDKLNREINEILVDPKAEARLADLGGAALVGSPADFGKLIATKPRNGPRSPGPSTSRRTEADPLSIFHKARFPV